MILDISILSLIIVGVTEAIKRGFQVQHRWIPLIAIGLAVGIGGTSAFFGLTDMTLNEAMIAGLMACGLWSGVKATIQKAAESIETLPIK